MKAACAGISTQSTKRNETDLLLWIEVVGIPAGETDCSEGLRKRGVHGGGSIAEGGDALSLSLGRGTGAVRMWGVGEVRRGLGGARTGGVLLVQRVGDAGGVGRLEGVLRGGGLGVVLDLGRPRGGLTTALKLLLKLLLLENVLLAGVGVGRTGDQGLMETGRGARRMGEGPRQIDIVRRGEAGELNEERVPLGSHGLGRGQRWRGA